MNVLATRGAGYVDSHAAKLLAAEGHEIWVYDNLVFEHMRWTLFWSLSIQATCRPCGRS